LQFKRHTAELSRIQATAAAERQALEQQLSATRRQLSQQQQQCSAYLQEVQQLSQERDTLQEQLVQSHQAQLAAVQQGDDLRHQVQLVQYEEQQEQDEAAAAAAVEEEQQQQHQVEVWRSSSTATSTSSAAEVYGGDDDAVLHSLRAQLGVACAEIAQLRHELDVATSSQAAERDLTGQEILRLQQELSEAVSSSSEMNSRGAVLRSSSCGTKGSTARPYAHIISADQATAAEAGEITSPLLSQQQQQQPQCSDENEDSDKCSWHSVLPSSAACEVAPSALLAGSRTHHSSSDPEALPAADEQQLKWAACMAHGSSSLQQYEAQLQDQADTIASLQQQLKQQQMLLAALQRRDRRVRLQAGLSWAACHCCNCCICLVAGVPLPGSNCSLRWGPSGGYGLTCYCFVFCVLCHPQVYDSAASRSSWVEALGLDQQQQQQQQGGDGVAAPDPAAVNVADAAVQTDSTATESAGSTAAVPVEGGMEVTSPAASGSGAVAANTLPRAPLLQDRGMAGDSLADSAAGHALLAAARQEILRLQAVNQQLLLSHAAGEPPQL
jgi:hypothetical protein